MCFVRTLIRITALACAVFLMLPAGDSAACTTIMVGKDASDCGSVLMSSSCDGNQMGYVHIMREQTYPDPERIPMQRNGGETGAYLPRTEATCRAFILGAGRSTEALGGMNEHGVSIGIEFIPMRPELDSTQGIVGPYSNHWTTSLIANGLMRAESAREAIAVIGAMVEEYGFLYTWGGNAGVALPIADPEEAWLMEIFGPEEGWTAESDSLGGVWCAQRVPDDGVGLSANRSRIGEVDLDNEDEFMASPNIHSLAERLDFWEEGEPFLWNEVYGDPGGRGNSMREWRVFSLAAPSLDLKDPVDPVPEAYPFSVTPDEPITMEQLFAMMRDGYEGTEYDVTEAEGFQADGEKSPLARPWGPPELFELVDVEPERAIATPTTNYLFTAQLRSWLPDPIGNVLWLAPGPAYSSGFAPIYAGANALPASWDGPADFDAINCGQVHWNYRLVSNLVTNLNYQEAIGDVREVIESAEEAFLARQADVDEEALRRLEDEGRESAEAWLTEYTRQCLENTAHGYDELVDYLMFQYLYDRPDIAPMAPPRIEAPDSILP